MIRKLFSLIVIATLIVIISPLIISPLKNVNAEAEFNLIEDEDNSNLSDSDQGQNDDELTNSLNEEETDESKETNQEIDETVEENQENEEDDKEEIKQENEPKITTQQSTNDDYILKRGDNNPEVRELKLKLAKIGFVVSSNPNNSFGPSTERVVKQFQEYYGLDVTGAVDEKTLSKIEDILSSPFQNGKAHDDVIQLKKDLERLGFKVSNNPNRNYGPTTTRKVKEFQEFYGLVVNGIVDEVTREKMDELLNSPLKRGDYRKDVINLKQDLAELGFVVSNNPNPSFGPTTERTVKEFQRYYGLKETGIVDSDTEAKIKSLLENLLRRGQKSNDVLKVKQDLAKLGFVVSSNPNTTFGPTTERTVKEFQKYYGLKVSGIVEEKTLEKIEDILSGPFQNGKAHDDVIQLKKDLERLGFKVSNNPNRNYGPTTTRKVREFQEFYGLVVNGIVDEVTREKMDELLNSPLKRGDYRKDVINLKQDLAELGFVVSNNPNPSFGPTTERTVKEFQRYYGLKETGIVDSDTEAKIKSLLENSLRRGQKSNDVLKVKQDLAKLGFVVSSNPNTTFGPTTERTVKEFQKYYGLKVSGIVEEKTLEKIEDILSSPFQNGKAHDDVIQLKKDLERLGFKVSNNPNRNYGPTTTRKVKEFQAYYNLVVNGIADEVTLNKIKSVLSSPLQRGNEHKDVIKLKKDLQTLGYGSFAGNERFGPATEKAVKKFQQDHNLAVSGIADEITLAKIEELLQGRKYTNYNLTLDEAVKIQMRVNPQTDQYYVYVSKNYIDKNNTVTASALNVRSGPGTNYSIIGTLSKGTKVDILGESGNFYAIEYAKYSWVTALEKDVRYYLNPENFANDSKQMFQFLDLSRLSGASVSLLNSYLKGKGILEGQGQAFIDAGYLYGVNEVYLLSHALLETGNGSSRLANGIEVGRDRSGKLQLVTKSNRNRLTSIRKTYNMYGIGARDEDPERLGAIRAYEEGWFTPYDAIVGGARFIGNNYIQAGQNTLYKMRWNPAAMEKGSASHQYATDIRWAYKQVDRIYQLYQDIGIDTYNLDIPVYK